MGVIFDVLAGLAAGVVSSDIVSSADRVCVKIVHHAALRVAPAEQEIRESEWLADLAERRTVLEKYRHAIGVWLAAPGMRRRASKVVLQLNFVVAGVGSLPMNIDLTSISTKVALKVLSSSRTPHRVKSLIVTVFLIKYGIILVLKAKRHGQAQMKTFVRQVPNFKDWTHQAKLKFANMELDFTSLIHAMKRRPDKAPEIFNNYMREMGNFLKNPSQKPISSLQIDPPSPEEGIK